MLAWVNQYLFGTVVPFFLVAAGIFYGFRLRWFHVRHPLRVFRALTERRPEAGVSPLRALCLALAGTLGVGNIVGVSAAIAMGGFGSIFWMWISAFFAMLLKYAEIVLAMAHRRYDKKGKPHGAAMCYMRDFFDRRGRPLLGATVAGIFACLCIMNAVTMGSVIQINAVTGAVGDVWGIPPLWVGGVLAIVTFLIIRKGTEGMIGLTGRLVPLMTLLYLTLSAAVLILRAEAIPAALGAIVKNAFRSDAAMGGIGGFLLSSALRYGTMRGLVSNEAGCGTAPAAHAVSDCRVPAKQGLWGIFEVFTDTILLCTVTALVVIVSWSDIVARDGEYMQITLHAYSAVLGNVAAHLMTVCVLFFGFATVICWAHYGMESVRYLSRRPIVRHAFIMLYSLSVFYGAFASSETIWQAADFAVGAMTLINLIFLCLMSGEVRHETNVWLRDAKDASYFSFEKEK